MPTYEFRFTQDGRIEIEEDAEVVTAQYNRGGHARSWAFVKLPPSEGVDEDEREPVCGAPTTNGTCQRTVSSVDERCWDHEDE